MHAAWMLAGATATGKTAAVQLLAERLGCAVLSADAMLVYRGMDIGTAKPSAAERGAVPYYGLDIVSPDEPFSTGRWLEAAKAALADAASAPPETPALIVAGGTGLYIKALTEGLDGAVADPEVRARWQSLYEHEGLAALQRALAERSPDAFQTLADPSNPRRLIRALEHVDARGALPQQWRRGTPRPPLAALRLPREQLHARIARRVDAMFRQGLVEEVRSLRHAYPVWSPTAAQAIGYAEAGAVLDGTLTPSEAAARIAARTRQLAKRQETWFRNQAQPVWIDIEDRDPPSRVAERILETWRRHGPTTLVSP